MIDASCKLIGRVKNQGRSSERHSDILSKLRNDLHLLFRHTGTEAELWISRLQMASMNLRR
jgi:hypothetical protein